jgi:hypothetical protein
MTVVGSRAVSAMFHVLAVGGIVLSILLAVGEARHRPPVAVVEVDHQQVGTTIELSALVRNDSDDSRCPEIRAVARDRSDRDLAEVVLEDLDGTQPLPPGESVRVHARIEGLTEQQLSEQLDDVRAYAYSSDRC